MYIIKYQTFTQSPELQKFTDFKLSFFSISVFLRTQLDLLIEYNFVWKINLLRQLLQLRTPPNLIAKTADVLQIVCSR